MSSSLQACRLEVTVTVFANIVIVALGILPRLLFVIVTVTITVTVTPNPVGLCSYTWVVALDNSRVSWSSRDLIISPAVSLAPASFPIVHHQSTSC